jgi:hypothetical protein
VVSYKGIGTIKVKTIVMPEIKLLLFSKMTKKKGDNLVLPWPQQQITSLTLPI